MLYSVLFASNSPLARTRREPSSRTTQTFLPLYLLLCQSRCTRLKLDIVEENTRPEVVLLHGKMILRVRSGTDENRRQVIVEEWYRAQLKQAVTLLLPKWEPLIGVKVERLFVQRMKTKWGSCTPKSGNIRLNTDLAKKPRECLEYVLVHEMVHILEPTHNARLVSLMDSFVPMWQFYREAFNRLPVRHEHWDY